MDELRTYFTFAARYKVPERSSKIIVTHTLNYLLHKRVGMGNSSSNTPLSRNKRCGEDKKQLMSEADFIITSAIMWLYSPHKTSNLDCLLSTAFEIDDSRPASSVDHTTHDTVQETLMSITPFMSVTDILMIKGAIDYTDSILGCRDPVGEPDAPDQEPDVPDDAYFDEDLFTATMLICLSTLVAPLNIDNLIKDGRYRVSFLKEIVEFSLEAIDVDLHSYFYVALSSSLKHLTKVCVAVNFEDKTPPKPMVHSVHSVPETQPPRPNKRSSPSYQDPSYTSYADGEDGVDSQGEEEGEDEEELAPDCEDGKQLKKNPRGKSSPNEDDDFTSYLTKKFVKRDDFVPAVKPPKSKDPFRRAGEALKVFDSSMETSIPPYRKGMTVSALAPKKEIKKTTFKPRSVAGSPPKTYAEFKKKSLAVENNNRYTKTIESSDSDVARSNSDSDTPVTSRKRTKESSQKKSSSQKKNPETEIGTILSRSVYDDPPVRIKTPASATSSQSNTPHSSSENEGSESSEETIIICDDGVCPHLSSAGIKREQNASDSFVYMKNFFA